MLRRSDSSSTILPTANHRADLRRCYLISTGTNTRGWENKNTYLLDIFTRSVGHFGLCK